MKLTKTQIKIIQLMYLGYELFIHASDTDNKLSYYISKGYDNIYFRSDVYGRLLSNELIYQEQRCPFSYILTDKGEEQAVLSLLSEK
jgi:hypothetical protein